MDPLEYSEEFFNEIRSRYRSIIEQIPAIVYAAKYEEPDRWLYVSPQIESLLGFSVKEWTQDPKFWYKQLHPDDREIAVNAVIISRATGQSFHREYRLITRNRRVVWVLDKVTVIAAASGQPVYLLGVLHDITDRKKAEEELRRSEEIFRSTFENAPVGMAMVGLNDQILQVNRALCMMLGYTPDQVLGKTFTQITHPEDGEEKGAARYGTIERKKESFTQEKRFVHANGSMVWGQLDVALVTDKHNQPLYFLQQVQDLTERKRAEKLLQISGDRFRAFIENGTDMISLVDMDGTITYSSPSTQRVLGYSSTDYLGSNFFEKIHEADQTWVKALFSELVTAPGNSFNAEFRYKHQNDTWRWIELTATNAMNEPSVGGMIANYRDITDNRNTQDAIQIRAAQQSVLAQISQRALVDSDLSVFMTDLVDKIAETLSVEYCMILELQPDQSILLLRAGIGWRAGSVGNQLLDIDEHSMVGYTLLAHTPVLVDDLNSENKFIHQQFLLDHGVVCGMSVVIEGRDTPYGILAIHSAHQRSFSPNDIFFLQAIANVLSAAIGRIQADEALRNSEERYMLVATSANDGLWDWNLRSNEIYYSPRWKEMLGYTGDEIKNDIMEWLQRLHPADEERVRLALSPDLNAREARFELEFRIRHKDTSYRWALSRGVVIRDSAGVAYRMAGSLTDITERKLAEEQLQFDAFHDPLTSLSNRAYLMERLAHVIHIAKRKRTYRFAVLFLDLDGFKVVNDRFGHNVGDRFLKEVARRLSRDMRSMDTLARLGGDEFVILLEDIKGLKEATQVAERVQAQLADVFDLSEVKVTTSASIGIVCNDFVYEKPEDVLRDADIAMYSAKASGRAHYQVFSLTLREQTIVRLEREVDLRHALERNQFKIYYQPIYAFSSKLPIGVEALLRWKHPTQGLIMPSNFIRIAEDSNLIIPIDCFVLREACLQIQRWEKLYPAVRAWGVHVNLSSKHFVQPNLVDTIQGILRTTDFDPVRVNLEITESAIMENVELAMITTRHLHDIGIHISIDDFGTGYSSLNYLTRFPVDVLKLDQSFVPRIMTDKNTREIIDTVVKLAGKLGIRVVAEGIETIEQLSELQTLGCEYGQGYLLSKPVSQGGIAEMVAAQI